MFTVAKLIELFAVNKSLSAAKPHVLQALASLGGVVFLGVFGTFFMALVTAAALWVLFTQMLSDGMTLVAASLIAAAAALLVLGVTAWLAGLLWAKLRTTLDGIFRAGTPSFVPVVDEVGNVAGAFINGLRGRGRG